MADERITKRRLELRVKIARARLNYLAIGVLTLVNILLDLVGAGIEMPFYLTIPYMSYLLGKSYIGEPKLFGAMMVLFAVAVGFCAAYIWMFRRSAKKEQISPLLILILADTAANIALIAVFLYSSVESSMLFTQFLNLAFHIFVLIFIEGGRRAAYGLTVLPSEEDAEDEDGESADEENTDETE